MFLEVFPLSFSLLVSLTVNCCTEIITVRNDINKIEKVTQEPNASANSFTNAAKAVKCTALSGQISTMYRRHATFSYT